MKGERGAKKLSPIAQSKAAREYGCGRKIPLPEPDPVVETLSTGQRMQVEEIYKKNG